MQTAQVFIPHDEHVWVTGEILVNADAKGNVEVKVNDESCPTERTSKQINLAKYGLQALPPQNIGIPVHGVDDMTKLPFLHEPAILDNLKRRFKNSQPYTYTGEVCIAVNPYKWLNHFYTDELQASYSKKTRHELSPHVYATSTDAYRGLTVKGKNQSILVTGESGAGKTETVKILMNHLAFIASRTGDKTVDKLLKANPLLESFGNAKTSRNDNSSRFGKFSQLEFDDAYVLHGSKCITYLLEKSRVIQQTKMERNYHIMYQLLAAPEPVKQKLLLTGKKSSDFKFTNNGDTKTSMIEGKSDADHYKGTIQGLDLLGVGTKLRGFLEEALAGILHLGQIDFHAVKGNADEATIAAANGKFDESTIACCKMLGVSPESLANSVVTRMIDVEGKPLLVPLSVEQAASGRDALAKEIYNRIFQWLIYVINFNTCYACNFSAEEQARLTGRTGSCTTISLLDIFGFELFAKNGFEQFCINYANEKLQQRFTYDVFMTVQKEYQEEGLPWEIIKYKDNQETLDMIEGRLSIVDLLNEECQIPKGTDSNFYSKIKQNFEKHQAFSTDPRSRDEFTVRHYAAQVTYTVTGFMEANKDTVPNNLTSMLSVSENSILKRLFTESPYFGSQASDSDMLLQEENDFIINLLLLNIDGGEFGKVPSSDNLTGMTSSMPSSPNRRSVDGEGGRVRSMTRQRSGGFVVAEKILTKFKNQLGSLMDMVNATDVQYVRCVKPNPNKSSVEYDRRMVVDQLRSAGMIEAVRISRAAFPNRLLYRDFLSRFHVLKSKNWHASARQRLSNLSFDKQEKGITEELLMALFPDNRKVSNDGTGTTTHYAFGHTKVYFSSEVLQKLETDRLQFVLTHSITVQRFARGFLARLKTEKPAVRAKRIAEAEAKRKEMEAEAEAERIKLQAERQRVEEESRKAEVDRLKRIEEEKMMLKAKLDKLDDLTALTAQNAILIERLSQENQEAKAANEEKDKKFERLSRDLAAALEGFQTLQTSYNEQKRINDKQDIRNKELESSLSESKANEDMLTEKQAALAASYAAELALQKESEARMKEKMANENKRLAEEYEERLSREKLLVSAQKKPEPVPGDVGVEVLEEKGRMRIIIARKKATGELAVTA